MDEFADSEVIKRVCVLMGLGADLAERLVDLKRRVTADPAGARALSETLDRLSGSAAPVAPDTFEAFGDRADLVRLLAVVLAVPRMERAYAAQGLPAETLKLTLSDLKIWSDHHDRFQGGPGLSPRILGWMENHLQCRLFRVGRLQFRHKIFANPIQAFRHPVTGRVAAFTEGTFSPVLPWGKVGAPANRVDLSVWENVLKPGDDVLDLHIPEDGPLAVEPVLSSLKEGLAFFSRHFPGLSIRAVVCFSWLLDPAFPEILKPGGNLLTFMRLFYCFPLATTHSEILWRVFGREDVDPATAPRTTSLQRAVLDHLKAGGSFREAGGFICVREIAGPSAPDYWDNLPKELKP